jgi:hypothetical protein
VCLTVCASDELRFQYGQQDYLTIMRKGTFHLPRHQWFQDLEKTSSCILFCRPKRFGKTTLASCVGAYYDIRSSVQFPNLFAQSSYSPPSSPDREAGAAQATSSGSSASAPSTPAAAAAGLPAGTAAAAPKTPPRPARSSSSALQPTKEAHSFLVFPLDFSRIDRAGSADVASFRRAFEAYITKAVKAFLFRYQLTRPPESVDAEGMDLFERVINHLNSAAAGRQKVSWMPCNKISPSMFSAECCLPFSFLVLRSILRLMNTIILSSNPAAGSHSPLISTHGRTSLLCSKACCKVKIALSYLEFLPCQWLHWRAGLIFTQM